MNTKWDVIVVGGNVAGASMAKVLADSGFKVLLVERMAKDRIGSNTCGDGLDKQEFKRLGLLLPEGDFVDGEIFHAVAFAPDRVHTLSAGGVLRAVHRYKFCQHLINSASAAGAEIMDNTHAVGPVLKNDYLVGIKVKNNRGETKELTSRIVVDSSGINAVIRKRLPPDWWVAEKIHMMDTSVCFKETRIYDTPQPEPTVRGYISRDIAPGGYYWLAMRTKTKVNVGMGVKRTGSHPNPRRQIYEKMLPLHPELKNTKIKWHGGGLIPRRRPLECMVGNGFIATGDAAAMVNPMSGGGIGPSMYAGKLGGELLPPLLEKDDLSLKALWIFNHEYNLNYGHVQAANHVMRRHIEDLTDEQINALFAAELFTEEELIEAIEKGSLSVGFLSKLKKLGKLARHPRLLMALRRLYNDMKTAREIYMRYPENPDGFLEWRKEVRRFFDKLGH